MRYLLLLSFVIAGCSHAVADVGLFKRKPQPVQTVTVVTQPEVKESKQLEKRLNEFQSELVGRLEHVEALVQRVKEPEPTPPPLPIEENYLGLPEKIETEVDEWVAVKAKTNAKLVKWVILDKGLKGFPPEVELKDPLVTMVRSKIPGTYRFGVYTAFENVPSDLVVTMVVVHGPQPPPDPEPRPEPKPVPPITSAKLFIVTIDDWQARNPQMVQVLNDQTLWNGFTAQGHYFKKFNSTDPEVAKYSAQISANGGLPTVIIMAFDPNNPSVATWLNKDAADLKFPATADGFRQLVSKYTGK